MLIILEGTDCTGKTTLALALSEALDYDIVKGSSFEQAECTNYELFTKFMELTSLDSTILDRFIYSNEVYAAEYEDFAILTDDQRRFIEREIQGNAIIVYLYAESDTLVERFNARGDDYVTIDRFDSLKSRYFKSMGEVRNIPLLYLNTSTLSTDELVEYVLVELTSNNEKEQG